MIEGNRMYFGYGDISVGGDLYSLTFQNIKPPQEIGSNIIDPNVEYIGKQIRIKLSYSDAKLYIDKLENMKNNDNSRILELSDYILDFSNFNVKSVDVVIKHLTCIVKNYMPYLAC